MYENGNIILVKIKDNSRNVSIVFYMFFIWKN